MHCIVQYIVICMVPSTVFLSLLALKIILQNFFTTLLEIEKLLLAGAWSFCPYSQVTLQNSCCYENLQVKKSQERSKRFTINQSVTLLEYIPTSFRNVLYFSNYIFVFSCVQKSWLVWLRLIDCLSYWFSQHKPIFSSVRDEMQK